MRSSPDSLQPGPRWTVSRPSSTTSGLLLKACSGYPGSSRSGAASRRWGVDCKPVPSLGSSWKLGRSISSLSLASLFDRVPEGYTGLSETRDPLCQPRANMASRPNGHQDGPASRRFRFDDLTSTLVRSSGFSDGHCLIRSFRAAVGPCGRGHNPHLVGELVPGFPRLANAVPGSSRLRCHPGCTGDRCSRRDRAARSGWSGLAQCGPRDPQHAGLGDRREPPRSPANAITSCRAGAGRRPGAGPSGNGSRRAGRCLERHVRPC